MPKKTRRFESAPQDRLEAVGYLAPRFFRDVVGWDYCEVLVTDESDLRDFPDLTGDRSAEVAGMLDRVAAHYSVDGRLAKSTLIVDLLEFLASNGTTD